MNTQAVCIPNIGRRERQRRLIGGIIALALAVALLLVLIFTGLNPWWRLILFLPFWAGVSGVFQAREQT